MAGESAGDVARKQRAKAERLLRSAEMWDRGAEGERATGEVLDGLQAQGWMVFHDVRWPGRQRANIDHVVVGPPGIFVIDAKNWTGRIEVRDNTFRAHGRRQDKVVAAAADAALAVTALTSPPAGATTRGVLCFVRDEPIVGWCFDVMMCSTHNLREMLTSRPDVLSPEQVRLAAIELDLAFRAGAQSPAPPRRRAMAATTPSTRSPRRPALATSTRRPSRRRKNPWTQLTRLAVLLAVAMLLSTTLPTLLPAISSRLGRSLVTQMTPSYDTCHALRLVYPNGVGTDAAVATVKRKVHLPAALPSVYEANKALDVDGDGLICARKPRAR